MFRVHRSRRRPRHIFLFAGPVGVTLWADGAVSFQAFGHFLQVVVGDWWGPWRRPPPNVTAAELARWTRHADWCARADDVGRCTCGLDDAWRDPVPVGA